MTPQSATIRGDERDHKNVTGIISNLWTKGYGRRKYVSNWMGKRIWNYV